MSERKVFIFSMSAVETNKMISEQCLVFLCNSDMNMSKFYLVTYSSINPSIIKQCNCDISIHRPRKHFSKAAHCNNLVNCSIGKRINIVVIIPTTFNNQTSGKHVRAMYTP